MIIAALMQTTFCLIRGLWFSSHVTGTGGELPFTINQERSAAKSSSCFPAVKKLLGNK